MRPFSPQVQVTVDYVQAARTEPGQGSFPEKFCCTIMISGVNVAEALVRYFIYCVYLEFDKNDKKTRLEHSVLKVEYYLRLTIDYCSKGLATVVRYAQGNDDRSSKYD